MNDGSAMRRWQQRQRRREAQRNVAQRRWPAARAPTTTATAATELCLCVAVRGAVMFSWRCLNQERALRPGRTGRDGLGRDCPKASPGLAVGLASIPDTVVSRGFHLLTTW